MSIYITNPNIDDICKKGKIVSIKSCINCKYCKKLDKVIQGYPRRTTIVGIRVECNYENY